MDCHFGEVQNTIGKVFILTCWQATTVLLLQKHHWVVSVFSFFGPFVHRFSFLVLFILFHFSKIKINIQAVIMVIKETFITQFFDNYAWYL